MIKQQLIIFVAAFSFTAALFCSEAAVSRRRTSRPLQKIGQGTIAQKVIYLSGHQQLCPYYMKFKTEEYDAGKKMGIQCSMNIPTADPFRDSESPAGQLKNYMVSRYLLVRKKQNQSLITQDDYMKAFQSGSDDEVHNKPPFIALEPLCQVIRPAKKEFHLVVQCNMADYLAITKPRN